MWTQNQKRNKARRKYVVIAKVDAEKFVKYRGQSIEKLLAFLLRKWPSTRYANFFKNSGTEKGLQVASWGKIKGLINH